MNIRGAIFERFPNDLVDELDDTGFLVAFGDFLVVGDLQLHRVAIAHFIERFGADTVVFLERFFDFRAGRERESHRHLGIEPHGAHHRSIKRIAGHDLQHAFVQRDG